MKPGWIILAAILFYVGWNAFVVAPAMGAVLRVTVTVVRQQLPPVTVTVTPTTVTRMY